MTLPAGLVRPSLLFLGGAALFAVAYGQAPLYYSNQNQYFLHGLARAGQGLLAEDWLANTLDPTPVFSALVEFTSRFLHPWGFHVYYALLLGAYAAALLGLFAVVAGEQAAARRWPVFVALLVVVHSALDRWASYRWLGLDYPWYLQAGVAGQYVLGAMFQPSAFGALLVVAVCLFARGRPYLAAGCAALTATLHSTYLLHAGLLVLGFQAALLAERRWKQVLGTGVCALLLVAPVTVYVLGTFGPTSAGQFAEAQAFLVNFRIPHHARIDLWLDPIAGLQLGWIALGIVLAQPRRLRISLAVPGVIALLLTLPQSAIRSNTLALLFPWRLSAVLMPVATAVILSRLVAVLPSVAERLPARAASAAVVTLGVAGGVWIAVARLGFSTSLAEEPLFDFVRNTSEPGEVYFIPVTVPALDRTTRGSQSSDFKPIARKKHDPQVIPPDLQRFRLHAGAPIFVDFKSIPYKDVEVVEWYTRVWVAQGIQKQLREGRLAEALAELRRCGVTHLVVPAGRELKPPGLVKVHEDGAYQVYRLARVP
jgi:hypothetical protein